MSQWKLAALITYIPAMFFLLACQEQIFAQNEKPKAEMSSSNKVYVVVDHMPEYNGGSEALIDFLRSEMKYPKNARRNSIQGTTYTEFIVEKNGALTEVKILRGFNPECDAEALRVVKLMDNWNPGQQNEKIVRTKIVLPINFKLN